VSEDSFAETSNLTYFYDIETVFYDLDDWVRTDIAAAAMAQLSGYAHD
jgi:hypothetical protein